jgi:hypothetical protein
MARHEYMNRGEPIQQASKGRDSMPKYCFCQEFTWQWRKSGATGLGFSSSQAAERVLDPVTEKRRTILVEQPPKGRDPAA